MNNKINFRDQDTFDYHYQKHVINQKEHFDYIDDAIEGQTINKNKYLTLAQNNIIKCDYFYPSNYDKHHGLGQLRINEKINSLSITDDNFDYIKSFYIPINSHIFEFFMVNFLLYKNKCFFDSANKIVSIKNDDSKSNVNFWTLYIEDIYQMANLESPYYINGENNRILYAFYNKLKHNLPNNKYSMDNKNICSIMALYFSNKAPTNKFSVKINNIIKKYTDRISKNIEFLNSTNYSECMKDNIDLTYIVFEYIYNNIIVQLSHALISGKKEKYLRTSKLTIINEYYSEYEKGMLRLFNLL